MKPSSIFFPQTRVKSRNILNLLQSFKVSIGRAFAYFMEDFEEVMKLIEVGEIETDSLITTRIPLLDVVDNVHAFYDKSNNIKTLIFNENFANS